MNSRMEMKNRKTELNETTLALRQEKALLQERLAKEESEKLVAIEGRRTAFEKLQATLSELKKAANQRVVIFDDLNKLLQKYNQSLQHNNAILQSILETANESNEGIEKEKLKEGDAKTK